MALSPKLDWSLANPKWAAELNPIIQTPIVNGVQIKGIFLKANTPQLVNTRLGRKQQGFVVTNANANAAVWRTKDFNDLTLTLESSADVTIDLWVY